MKSYEEMTRQVLKRSEKEIEKRNIRRRKIRRLVASLACFCLIALIGWGMRYNEVFDIGESASEVEQIRKTDQNREINEAHNEESHRYTTKASNDKIKATITESVQGAANMSVKKKDETDAENIAADSESSAGISLQQAQINARAKLTGKEIESITNLENPKIEEMVFTKEPAIYFFDKRLHAVGKALYKITYHTHQDSLIGPIAFYVDKATGLVIGCDFRE